MITLNKQNRTTMITIHIKVQCYFASPYIFICEKKFFLFNIHILLLLPLTQVQERVHTVTKPPLIPLYIPLYGSSYKYYDLLDSV